MRVTDTAARRFREAGGRNSFEDTAMRLDEGGELVDFPGRTGPDA